MNIKNSKPFKITSRLPLKYDLTKKPKSSIKRDKVNGITIDGEGTQDIDDAINCIFLGDGKYKIQVHIADLSEVVISDSEMDQYAMSRVCTVYMEEYTNHMLSKNIATNISSFNEDGEKHSITYECIIDIFGKILDERVYRSSFKNIKKCNYIDYYDLKKINNNLYENLNIVSNIVSKIIGNVHEFERGIIDFRDKSLLIPVGPRKIVEKLMLFTNMRVALFLRDNYDTGIFRNHLKINKKTKYSNEMKGHVGLKFPGMTHFTSPLRRYVDIITHRILLGIGNYQHKEIGELCEYINYRIVEIEKELKMKAFNDFLIRQKRRIKKAKNGECEIDFKFMSDKQFKFNLIYLAKREYYDNQFKKKFLDELDRRYSLNYKKSDKNLLLYLFLIGDRDFKQKAYEIIIKGRENDTMIGNYIAIFFKIDERDKEEDENGFQYKYWQLKFNNSNNDNVLYQQKIYLDFLKGKQQQEKKKFITKAVLNGGVSLKMKDAIKILE